jgi:hypothetical protein
LCQGGEPPPTEHGETSASMGKAALGCARPQLARGAVVAHRGQQRWCAKGGGAGFRREGGGNGQRFGCTGFQECMTNSGTCEWAKLVGVGKFSISDDPMTFGSPMP